MGHARRDRLRSVSVRGYIDPATFASLGTTRSGSAGLAGTAPVTLPAPDERPWRAGIAVLLSIAALLGCGDPAEPPRGDGSGAAMHDHGAHHGGVVAMAGALHVEAVVLPDGSIRVYPTDLRRQPVPPTEVSGSVSLDAAGGTGTLELVPAGPCLDAKGPPLDADEVVLHLSLNYDGRASTLHLRVPVGAPELSGLPRVCQPIEQGAAAGRLPRCTVRLPRMVRTIAVTPDGKTALVAVFAHGVTAWRLPAGELSLGLSPMPGADEHPDHSHPVDALAIRPDGTEVAASAKGRILRYALASGELVADLPGSVFAVRALAWSADGGQLFASTFHDGTVRVVRADDASETGRLEVGRGLIAFALSPAGDLAVLASEDGPLTVFDVASGQVRQRLVSPAPVPVMAFTGRYLVAGRQDGALDFWDTDDRRTRGRCDRRSTPARARRAIERRRRRQRGRRRRDWHQCRSRRSATRHASLARPAGASARMGGESPPLRRHHGQPGPLGRALISSGLLGGAQNTALRTATPESRVPPTLAPTPGASEETPMRNRLWLLAAAMVLAGSVMIAAADSQWWTPKEKDCPSFTSEAACTAYCTQDPQHCGGSTQCIQRSGPFGPSC